jgi:hypothetical protein
MNEDQERDTWARRPPMSKEEKLELIKDMKAQLADKERK